MSSRTSAEPAPAAVLVGLLLSLPAVWLALFASLVVRVRLQKGVWPVARSGNPFDGSYVASTIDPQRLGLHHDAVWALFFVLQLAVPLAVVLLITSVFVRDLRPRPEAVAIFAVSVAMAVLLLTVDPGGYFLWFVD